VAFSGAGSQADAVPESTWRWPGCPWPGTGYVAMCPTSSWSWRRGGAGKQSRAGESTRGSEEHKVLAWPGALVERHGWEYEILAVADRVLLENGRFLAAYRRPGVVPETDIERAWESVWDGDQLADAERRLAAGRPDHEARPPLLALVWSGRLIADVSRPLSGYWGPRRSV
jgi:hypothetical protein